MKIYIRKTQSKLISATEIKPGNCFSCGASTWMVCLDISSQQTKKRAVRLDDGLLRDISEFSNVIPLEQTKEAVFEKEID